MSARINPSILSADFVNLQADLERIASADLVHVDVMDNHFVPNLTFGPQMVGRIQDVSPVPLDVHLMISDVDRWAPGYAELGAYSVTFHAEATGDPVALARRLRSIGGSAAGAVPTAMLAVAAMILVPIEAYFDCAVLVSLGAVRVSTSTTTLKPARSLCLARSSLEKTTRTGTR